MKDNNIRVIIDEFNFKEGWMSGDKFVIKGNWHIGDTVDAYVYKKKKGKRFCRAISDVGLDKCKYSNICGGCSFRKYSFSEQLICKKEYLENILSQEQEIEVLGRREFADLERGYRNKVELTFGVENNEITLGYHLPGSFLRIFNVSECKLYNYKDIHSIFIEWAKEYNLEVYNKKKHTGYLRHLLLRRGLFTNEEMVLLHTTTKMQDKYIQILKDKLNVKTFIWYISDDIGDAIKNGEERIMFGDGYIYETIGNIRFKIYPFTFFQTNSFMIKVLYDEIRKLFSAGGSLLDLYGGTGSIGLYLSDMFDKIVSIDENCNSIMSGKEMAILNNIDNIEFICSKIEDIDINKFEKVVIDPPRAGLSPNAMKNLLDINPKELVYVSCNPQTFVRDKTILIANGYKLKYIKGVDMFPYTKHVELVSFFKRGE